MENTLMAKANLGVTTIEFHLGHKIKVVHCGNMGATMEDVIKNVDTLLGDGAWDKMVKLEETGGPGYMYEAWFEFN